MKNFLIRMINLPIYFIVIPAFMLCVMLCLFYIAATDDEFSVPFWKWDKKKIKMLFKDFNL